MAARKQYGMAAAKMARRHIISEKQRNVSGINIENNGV